MEYAYSWRILKYMPWFMPETDWMYASFINRICCAIRSPPRPQFWSNTEKESMSRFFFLFWNGKVIIGKHTHTKLRLCGHKGAVFFSTLEHRLQKNFIRCLITKKVTDPSIFEKLFIEGMFEKYDFLANFSIKFVLFFP